MAKKMDAKMDAIKEARRAMSAFNEADQIYASLPDEVRAKVFSFAYAVERARSRIEYLLANSPEGA